MLQCYVYLYKIREETITSCPVCPRENLISRTIIQLVYFCCRQAEARGYLHKSRDLGRHMLTYCLPMRSQHIFLILGAQLKEKGQGHQLQNETTQKRVGPGWFIDILTYVLQVICEYKRIHNYPLLWADLCPPEFIIWRPNFQCDVGILGDN